MEFDIYSVYWKNIHNHTMMNTVTALSSKDAKIAFRNVIDAALVKKITKVVKGYGMPAQTPKQKLSQKYRSCIGACKMAEKNIYAVVIEQNSALGDKEFTKRILARNGAIKHIQNAERDIRELFARLGLKIK